MTLYNLRLVLTYLQIFHKEPYPISSCSFLPPPPPKWILKYYFCMTKSQYHVGFIKSILKRKQVGTTISLLPVISKDITLESTMHNLPYRN